MSERTPFPPPPGKSVLAARDGAPTLGWLNWFGVVASTLQRVRVLSVDVDVPSISAGDTWWGEYTFKGAQPGDFAWASLDPADRFLTVNADVVSANTVRVAVRNFGAGAVDLAAGTLRIRLEKAR